jgi:hypothetical protein
MKHKVTITRTDAGATTAVMSSAYEWSKSYTSRDQGWMKGWICDCLTRLNPQQQR